MTLFNVQQELKAPKGQRNTFGNYNYRSCEDILEAVKPLLKKHKLTLTISDEIFEIGGRVYVQASANIQGEDQPLVSVTAYAREPENKKGMDESQITGAASSYARKYALNGLFCIDDTKDADATNQHNKELEKPFTNGKTLVGIERELKSCQTTAQLAEVYEDNKQDISALTANDKEKLRKTYKELQDKLKPKAANE